MTIMFLRQLEYVFSHRYTFQGITTTGVCHHIVIVMIDQLMITIIGLTAIEIGRNINMV
jgi:hypothetical protein